MNWWMNEWSLSLSLPPSLSLSLFPSLSHSKVSEHKSTTHLSYQSISQVIEILEDNVSRKSCFLMNSIKENLAIENISR